MNNISRDISDRTDPDSISVLGNITEVARELGIPFFVLGAFARDVIFEHIHDIPTARATKDIDIGVEVARWEDFDRLTNTLVARGHLMATQQPHRFESSSSSTPVDIVPYGAISDDTMYISWPPNHERVMSMLGFEEAYRSAITVRLSKEPSLEVLVPSMAALTLLKIISWDDAYPRRSRDAEDLFFMLQNCGKAKFMEIYESHEQLLEQEGYDPDLAAIRLLGQEIAQLGCMGTQQALQNILVRESDENGELKLLRDMNKETSMRNSRFEHALRQLKKLLQGMQDENAA